MGEKSGPRDTDLFFWLIFVFYFFLERGREREISIDSLPTSTLTGDWTHTWICTLTGIELSIFVVRDNTLTNWAIPAREETQLSKEKFSLLLSPKDAGSEERTGDDPTGTGPDSLKPQAWGIFSSQLLQIWVPLTMSSWREENSWWAFVLWHSDLFFKICS